MKTKMLSELTAIISGVLLFASCQKTSSDIVEKSQVAKANEDKSSAAATVSVFAKRLQNPRELKFGPDGYLYVAEGGRGGDHSTVGECKQVVTPVGPYTGRNMGGRISKISPSGERTTVTSDLPSSQTSAALGSLISGVADIEFIGNTLYALLAGAGCSHGVTGLPNGIVRVNADGSWKLVANLSAFQKSHPVANTNPGDFEPDGTWYSMTKMNGDLYAVEPNHGELVKVTTSGEISRVIDVSASQGHVVPTVITKNNGNFFVGTLIGNNIYKITPGGQISVFLSGFTGVLGIAFDTQNRLYVLDNAFPIAGAGEIVRITPPNTREVIASGLNLPTGMTFGPDGKLYVSNNGYGAGLGEGQILQITVNH
jgi:glucose/arabinose dehydrogenase